MTMELAPIPWRVQQEEDCCIGICDLLKMTVESGSLDELKEDICEALDATFQSLEETGDLENYLAKYGLAADRQMHLTFQIPFTPAMANADSTATDHR